MQACHSAKLSSSMTARPPFSPVSVNAKSLKLCKSGLEAENKRVHSREPVKKEEEDIKEKMVKEENPVMLALLCALPSLGLIPVPSISSDPSGQVTFDAVPCPSGNGVHVRLIETSIPTASSSSTPSLSYSSPSSSLYSAFPASSSYIAPLYDPFLLSEPQDDLDFAFQDTAYHSERKNVRISRQSEEWVVRMC